MNKKVSMISVVFALAFQASAVEAPVGAQVWTASNPLTLHFCNEQRTRIMDSKGLRLLVWNVHKAADENLPKDFARISTMVDLALVQESVSAKPFREALCKANPELGWTQAKSFEVDPGSYTGVATGSRVEPIKEEALLSNVTEPVLSTPKTIILSEFARPSGKNLLVANMHAINFVTTETFREHVRQLMKRIKQHDGPMIVAGDFNTWNSARLDYLNRVLHFEGLSNVIFPHTGLLELDHVFVRGLKKRFAFNVSLIDSSDHEPILVDLLFND